VPGYTTWLFTGNGLLTVLALSATARRSDGRCASRRADHAGVVAGALSLAAYGLILWAQTQAALAVVAALRETSVVFAAILGAVVFHERMPSRRILASVVIAAGQPPSRSADTARRPHGPLTPGRPPSTPTTTTS